MTLNNRTVKVLVIIAVVAIAAGVIAHLSQAKRTNQHLQDLASQEPDKVMEAMTQLRERGKSVGPRLVPLVQEGKAEAAPRAAWLLGMVGSPAGNAALVTALSSKDGVLRIAALQSLGKLRVADAAAPAGAILADTKEKPDVRSAAAYCLGMIGGEAVAKLLTPALADHPKPLPPPPPPVPGAPVAPPPPPDTTISLRVAIASALGEAKLVGGTEALSAAVREDTEPSPEVRTAAAYALGDLGAAAAEEAQQRLIAQALADGLGDKAGDVRIACAYSLGKVTLPTDMEAQMGAALKKACDDKHYWARLAAQTSHTQLKLAD